ncbi:MAG: methylenetetrahydrofolate--tRNA-(uracil(54)-C(5))-methyltransferase (FADH(2)-oxidizing) TrmFO [Ruminococcaceae bacterium]|nr:methylenetetrahydrofolate--tRNA-(uracil(54)-C(5))-methyltransferase (FADH(2)-oxidizing) TrmFO [Oscillospiraceae bacterium]
MNNVNVIGAGLAGCEAAFYLAERGIKVTLYEMKPTKKSPAHKSDLFAELVCSNSLKAARIESAAGLLKEEMRRLGSICLESADKFAVPAGGALAVERNGFSEYITQKIKSHPNIEIKYEIVEKIPTDGVTIIATGPLTDDALAEDIRKTLGSEYLNFFDAAAPIVSGDSIDMNSAFYQSRYDKGEGDDYINCPLNKAEYEAFHSALISAERAPLKDFEGDVTVYEGCMPIEILASRGTDAIRFGPMKPVGLTDPNTGHRPWAVLQLRKENCEGSMYNLVGFQTNLKFGEQKRVFSMIPALKDAEFMRYGVMHRNSFINSPQLLSKNLSLKTNPNVFFAGQLSGVEGYMESAASGILAAINVFAYLSGKNPLILPTTTMLGAIVNYITDPHTKKFQPMGANFGLLPPLETRIRDKKERYGLLAKRGLENFEKTVKEWIF